MRYLLTFVALAGFAVPLAGAADRPRRAKPVPLKASPDLWATVNVCDTEKSPDQIGVRGSMPGLGKRASLYMRFQVQYLAKADGKWHNIEENADSGYRKLGVASKRVLESGWTFKFLPPPDGGTHTLRGAVTFVWRQNGRIVEKLRETTESGHRSTSGADPPNHSSALCMIS